MLESIVVDEIRGILAETDLEKKLGRTSRLCAESSRIGLAKPDREPGVRQDPDRETEAQRDSDHEGEERWDPDGRSESLRVPAPDPPGRPADWTVLEPFQMRDRPRLGSARGRYLLLHSVAHIELSAIELALMAVADFPDEPREYYQDMLGVAQEEVLHCRMVQQRLRELGGEFGSDPVHLGLWNTAKDQHDIIARLAVVPRILEARGLDVSERLRMLLGKAGDFESARILERIYRDEIGHVAVGTKWYRAACQRRGLDPEEHFLGLLGQFRRRRSGNPGPIDRAGRLAAGFTAREIDALENPES